MIIELPKGEITFDDVPVIKDLRMNLVGDKARIKFTVLPDKDIDLSIYSMKVGVKGKGIGIELTGCELESRTDFSVTVTYQLLKRKWGLSGSVGYRNLDSTYSSLLDLIRSFNDIL